MSTASDPIPASRGAAPGAFTSQTFRKRKRPESFGTTDRRRTANKAPAAADEDENGDEVEQSEKKGKKRVAKSAKDQAREKRLRRFRPKPTQDFQVVYDRATSQRFYVLSRWRAGTDDECPEEIVEMTGSTGNIYHVHISQLPACTCPHATKGNQCKHMIYVMARVLRARFDLVYQLALLPSELREIFSQAPPIEISDDDSAKEQVEDKNRKAIDGDCPICFTPLEGPDDTTYCRAQCGQNMHTECFEMWATTKRASARDRVTCPMCRAPWQGADVVAKNLQNAGVIGDEGYVNVAGQLGISRMRAHITMGHAVVDDTISALVAPDNVPSGENLSRMLTDHDRPFPENMLRTTSAPSLDTLPIEAQCAIFRLLDPVGLISASQTCKSFRGIITLERRHFVERLLALECLEEHGGPSAIFRARDNALQPNWNDEKWESMRWACTGCLRLLPHRHFDNHSLLRLGYRKPVAGSPAAVTPSSWEPSGKIISDAARKRRRDAERSELKMLKRRYAIATTLNWGQPRQGHSLVARLRTFHEAGMEAFLSMDLEEFEKLNTFEEAALLDLAV
ncbi:hypothetical protein DL765_003145 [Monosporascus sp. GIB2]|nr:hypothetical protein DL765_003145 [Monosporascus sp. GIB2]